VRSRVNIVKTICHGSGALVQRPAGRHDRSASRTIRRVTTDAVPMAPPTLTAEGRAFLSAERFGVIATVGPDGSPHQAVVWYRLEGDELVVNSAVGRRWPADLRRDPRTMLTIADGYRYVQVSGEVIVVEDQPTAQADIAEMARRYHVDEPEEAEALIENRFSRQQRISFRLRPKTIKEDL
jgi:PPOX class probable F420-dependent enzyme